MRILVCNWKDLMHPAAGGAEVYVDAVTRQWAANNHDVTIFSSAVAGQPSEDIVAGVRVVRAGSRLTVYREARRFYQSHPRQRYDVVLDVVNTRPFLAPRWVEEPVVVALIFQVAREVWDHELTKPLALLGRHVLEPSWLRSYARVPTVTISASSRDSLEEYGLRSVVVIPVGLELPTITAAPPREPQPTVLFLGRLASNKRPDHALAAFRAARDAIPNARMWVMGGGPLEKRLRRAFSEDEVQFLGRVPTEQKLDRLARAHALLVTSVREGWGLVVTEAAALGTPSIGYDIPGLRDSLLASGGVIVPPTVVDLAAAVRAKVPGWAAGELPPVHPGGVAPWAEVAARLLAYLEEQCCANR